MNERLMRAAEPYFAEFLTAFEDEDTKTNEPLWLIWQYEVIAAACGADVPSSCVYEPVLVRWSARGYCIC